MGKALNILVSKRIERISAVWVSKMGKRVDFVVIYRILLALKENNGSLNITQLIRFLKSSASTIERYAEILKAKGFVVEKTNRERRLYITRKGEDFLFLFSRLLALYGE